MLSLVACGGTGGENDLSSGTPVSTSGIAVDPYIVGARFEEVSADGLTLIQRQSSLSDSAGRFSFPEPVKEGSTIRLKQGAKGTHAGAPYTGMIKRRVSADDNETLVVSPLTTLLANGMTGDEILFMMDAAGLPGLTLADLTADPMTGLESATSVTDAMLIPLQANMAANAYMEAGDDFDFRGTPQTQAVSGLRLADMVLAVKETLNADLYRDLSAAIDSSLTLGDLIQTAARLHRTIVTQVKEDLAANDQSLPPGRIAQAITAALADAPSLARDIHQGRIGNSSPPGSEPAIDGGSLFAQLCASCHTLGTGSGLMDLAGDGAKISAKFAATHMGRNLDAAQQAAVAAHLNAQGGSGSPGTNPGGNTGTSPTPAPGPIAPPAAPPTGAELYAAECQGCHGNLQNSDIANRSAAGISGAISTNLGGMGFIVLSNADIQAIADALPAPPAPPVNPAPPQERGGQAVYEQDCAACHALGSFDTSGSINLAGLGAQVLSKLQAGHMGKNPTSGERTALATFVDSFGGTSTPAPTPDPTPAPAPNYADCAGCHGSKPAGPSNPAAAGAHAAHLAVSGIAGNCNICHDEANHAWGAVDILADFDATAGRPATFNVTGTCSNISCHGGVQTPPWATGTIAVATECQKCHTAGTAVYSDYSSGRHSKHRNYACTSCHDTNKLAANHFGNLGTKQFEQNPASTLLANLNYVNNNCTLTCHGENHNPLRWR